MAHTLATGRKATFVKITYAATAKVTSAFILFILTALVTRNMPGEEAGLFLLGISLLGVMSVIFRLGLDNVILRFLSAHSNNSFAQDKLNRGLQWIVTLSIPAALFGIINSKYIAIYIFQKPEFGDVLFWLLPALPAMAIFFLLSFAFQSQHRVITTAIFQKLGISSLFIIGFGYLLFNMPSSISAVNSAKIYTVAAIIICVAAIVTWYRQSGTKLSLTSFSDHELKSASLNLWVASCMGLAVEWSGLLIAGVILTAEDVALLSAAQRTAMLTSFVLMVVNMVVAPRYAKMWKESNLPGIERLAKYSTRGMVTMVIPVVIIIFLFSEQLMSLFGVGYEAAGILLIIMTIGQFINVSTGSVGYLLNMSGHEEDFRKVTLMTGPISIIISILFITELGLMGAAIATAISVGIQNVAALIMVKKRLGFIPIG
ncbi:MAG: oligosaccharide flippase family protein [Candidatus Thiodiazotropha lotti]|uniref:Oligosaccharide flippase family protein n=1 Tax=Candidatus Thiodiazotropha lotti TaxID=2792787 RepID=A0A9E4K5P4_9GAMM|nr:oligosaccharide flippase family protein [Candidatus Thiodiazotropha lotti]MCW4204112.1 oligosaccharide flippase family protein [Candidatus Thiodiazotropha lotti]